MDEGEGIKKMNEDNMNTVDADVVTVSSPERDELIKKVEEAKGLLMAAKANLVNFDKISTSTARGPRARRGTQPTIEEAIALVILQAGNQPMTAYQVYEGIKQHTEWTYRSNDIITYIKYTLSGRSDIFDRPQVKLAGKLEKRGWYSVKSTYKLRDEVAALIPVPTEINVMSNTVTADEIINTEFTLANANTSFKPLEKSA